MENVDHRDINAQINAAIKPLGLVNFGTFQDAQNWGVLIGNVGSSHWSIFNASAFAQDGKPDPMNRWTEAVMEPIADRLSCEVRFPFGDVLWPFQAYAKQAAGMSSSPLGLLIHPEFGLWTAFRAALIFSGEAPVTTNKTRPSPCLSCAEKPCLTRCPVDAFSSDHYDVSACRNHVRSDSGENCRSQGCMARRACPVGQDHHYEPAQQAFHMAAFAPVS